MADAQANIDDYLARYRRGEFSPGAALRGAPALPGDAGPIVRQGNSFSMTPAAPPESASLNHVGGRIGVAGFDRLPAPAPTQSPQQRFDEAGLLNPRNPNLRDGLQRLAADVAPAISGVGLQRNANGGLSFRPADSGDPGQIVRQGSSFTMLRQPDMPADADVSPPVASDKPPRRVISFSEMGDASPQPGALLRDAWGNSVGPTQAFQRQLDQVRAEKDALDQARQKGMERAPGASYEEQQQAKADRFTRFVNESATAAMIKDLASGGGTARTNAGKIAAVHAAQHRDAAEQASELTRAARVIEANMARRGQDLLSADRQKQHDVELQKILGSPLQQQGQMLELALKNGQLTAANVLQSLQQKLLDAGKAKDANAQSQYALLIQQILGKTPESKLVTIGGGQEVDAATGVLRALPSQLAYTGPAPTIVSASPGPEKAAAGPKPSLDQFKAHVTAKNPGASLTDEQIAAAYQKQFGGL